MSVRRLPFDDDGGIDVLTQVTQNIKTLRCIASALADNFVAAAADAVVARDTELKEVRAFLEDRLDPDGSVGDRIIGSEKTSKTEGSGETSRRRDSFGGAADDAGDGSDTSQSSVDLDAEDEFLAALPTLRSEAQLQASLGGPSVVRDGMLDPEVLGVDVAQPSAPKRRRTHPRRDNHGSKAESDNAGDVEMNVGGDDTASGGGVMFVCGVPGSGKTLSVTKAVRSVIAETEARAPRKSSSRLAPLPIFLNAMELSEPHMAYVYIWQQLQKGHAPKGFKPARLGAKRACELLGKYFGGSSGRRSLASELGCGRGGFSPRIVVLVADEMDWLVNKNQTVLYNLFQWSTQRVPNMSRLCIIGISNTLDLPQTLQQRVASRMTKETVLFKPYARDQLIQIISARLRDAGSGDESFESFVENDAVELCAKRVASYSFGDARKMLTICRAAALSAMQEAQDLRQNVSSLVSFEQVRVTVSHVEDAFSEHFESVTLRLVASLPDFHRRVLQVLAQKVKREAVDICLTQELWEELRYRTMQANASDAAMLQAPGHQVAPIHKHINLSQLGNVLQQLSETGLVQIEQRGVSGVPLLCVQVRLAISPETVEFGLSRRGELC